MTGGERADSQLFIVELCGLLDLPMPKPAHEDTRDNAYVFGRRVTLAQGDRSQSHGFVRQPRPDFQRRNGAVQPRVDVDTEAEERATVEAAPTAAPPKRPWPAGLPEQIEAVAEVFASSSRALGLADLEQRFTARGRWRDRLPTIVDTLEALGRARHVAGEPGRWLAL